VAILFSDHSVCCLWMELLWHGGLQFESRKMGSLCFWRCELRNLRLVVPPSHYRRLCELVSLGNFELFTIDFFSFSICTS
jgi:hypothetical protein